MTPPSKTIDPATALALTFAPLTIELERGRLRFFAETIGLTDPIYTDVDSARRAGHPDLPAPPTFLGNSLELGRPDLSWLSLLKVDRSQAAHAEQWFEYRKLAYAGDTLTLRRRIVDVYQKKGGALEFIVKRTDVERAGDVIVEAYCSIVVKHPEVNDR